MHKQVYVKCDCHERGVNFNNHHITYVQLKIKPIKDYNGTKQSSNKEKTMKIAKHTVIPCFIGSKIGVKIEIISSSLKFIDKKNSPKLIS